jgi:hypothetical protein
VENSQSVPRKALSFDSTIITDVHVQNFGKIVDLEAQRWSKHRWFNSECARFPKLEAHY